MNTQDIIIRDRSSMVLKGIGLVTFGLVALCYPGEAIRALLMPFGVLVTINGAVAVCHNIKYFTGDARGGQTRFQKGVLELLIGLAAIGAVVIEAPVFKELVALWAILTGSTLVSNFYLLRDRMPRWSVMVGMGVISMFFGLLLAINAVAEVISLGYGIALFALLLGASMFYAYAQLGQVHQYLGCRPKKIFSPYTFTS